jgi:hypothetical protein
VSGVAAFGLDRVALGDALDRDGYALIPGLLDPHDRAVLAAMAEAPMDERFRSQVIMQRHAFGRGEYRYFARPLPPVVQALRETLYPPLAALAEVWAERLGRPRRWPATHAAFAAECAAAGQSRPTPLLLAYGPGDYNRLHQDLYGDLIFPIQVVILLDAPGRDFTGGELVLTEGRARMQSRPVVVPLSAGDAAVIPVRERPVASVRGWTRATLRHGVAEIRSGRRRTLGIIFHDAA